MTNKPAASIPLGPTARRRGSLLVIVGLAVAASAFIAWVLTTDAVQRWAAARKSTPDLEASVSRAPDSGWAYYELGVRYARQGRLAEAVKLFERARQALPDAPEVRIALGRAYIYGGNPLAAASELRRATELDEKSAPAHRYLAVALRLAHDPSGAMTAARRATTLDPTDADGWYQYGVLFTPENGTETEGRPFLKKAVDLKPADGVYALAYGKSLVDGSQFGEAIPYLRTAVKALPRDPNAHFFLALALHRAGGAADEAAGELRAAIQLAPNDYKSHFELGNVLEEQSKFAAALPEFETASRLNPSLSEIWFHLSRMADRAGQRAKAADARARFTEIRKYHVEFTTLVRQLQANPNNTAIEIRVGEVLEKQGKARDAAVQYMDVLKREPANSRARADLDALRLRMHWPELHPDDALEGAQ